MRMNRKQARRRGVAMVEFAFITLVLVPLLLGTAGVGLNMIRALETVQLARDAGHMFARGADFSQPGNKTILTNLGADLGLTTATNSGASVILSTVTYIDKAMCAADGKVDGSGNPMNCTNYTKWVFARRLVIGNPTMRPSSFGAPVQSVVNATTGAVTVHDQVTNTGDVATFSGINPYSSVNGKVIGLPSGQVIYIAEAASTGIMIQPYVPNATMYSFSMF